MSSEGTATDISSEDAAMLLHKLIAESTKLQAWLRSANGSMAGVHGTLGRSSATQLVVKPDASPDAPFIAFDLAGAERFRYAAGRAIPDVPRPPGVRFASTLSLIYTDSSQIILMELA
jgi:hypothetical protein